jgi:hypothetical protein
MTAQALWTPTRGPKTIMVSQRAGTQTVNNSETLVAHTELLFPVGADEQWGMNFYLRKLSTVATIKFQFSIPSGGTFRYVRTNTAPGNETDHETNDTISSDAAIESASYIGLYVGGGTAGTINLTFAQNAADLSNTSVVVGSYILATKLK